MKNETSLSPWLSVANGFAAVAFYEDAFGAKELFRFEPGGGALVARLSVGTSEFWISGDPGTDADHAKKEITSIRMLLTVPDPELLFEKAIKAGGKIIYPVSESHGWRIGRLEDPFGFHWEIGMEI